MMAFCPEHPKWDQNPKFTPLRETTSIPTPFICGVPPPGSGSYRVTKHSRKPSHSRTKRKSLIIIRIQEALRGKLNNLKPLFSGNEEHCNWKEVKGNVLGIKGQIMPTRNNNNRRKCDVGDHLRSRIIYGLGIICGWGSFAVLYSTVQIRWFS